MEKPWEKKERPEFIELIEYKYYVYTTRFGGEWFAIIDEDNDLLWVGGVPNNWEWKKLEFGTAHQCSSPPVFEVDEVQWLLLVIRLFYSIVICNRNNTGDFRATLCSPYDPGFDGLW